MQVQLQTLVLCEFQPAYRSFLAGQPCECLQDLGILNVMLSVDVGKSQTSDEPLVV